MVADCSQQGGSRLHANAIPARFTDGEPVRRTGRQLRGGVVGGQVSRPQRLVAHLSEQDDIAGSFSPDTAGHIVKLVIDICRFIARRI
jgi:hypothetical protein